MSFIEKIKQSVTGKTAEQRANDRLATNIASRQINRAAFEERSRQMTRVAVEKEKMRADAMLRKAKESYNRPSGSGSIVGGFANSFRGTSSPVGGASMLNAFGNPVSKVHATFNPVSGVWGSTGVSAKPKTVKRVKHRRRRARPRRMVYVRKYI